MPNFRPPPTFSGFDYGKFHATLQYLYDSQTSGFRAAQPEDYAVSILASGVTITGSLSIDDTIFVSGGIVGLTGNPQVGISGFTSNALLQVQAISGNINVVNQPVHVTGLQNLNQNSQIGISGYTTDALAQTQKFSGSVNIINQPVHTTGVQNISPNAQIGVSGFTTVAQQQTLTVTGVQSLIAGTVIGISGTTPVTGSVLILPSPNAQIGVSGFTDSARGQSLFVTGNVNSKSNFESPTGVLYTGQICVVGAVARTGVPVAVADGFAVEPWFDDVGRQVIYGADVSQGVISVTDVAPALTQSLNTTLTTLSTLSGTAVVDISNYSYITAQMTFSNLTGEISGEIKFSVDNSNFYQGILETTAMSGLNIAANRFGVTGVGSITRGISAKKQGQYFRLDLLNSGSDAGSWSCVPKIYASIV